MKLIVLILKLQIIFSNAGMDILETSIGYYVNASVFVIHR